MSDDTPVAGFLLEENIPMFIKHHRQPARAAVRPRLHLPPFLVGDDGIHRP